MIVLELIKVQSSEANALNSKKELWDQLQEQLKAPRLTQKDIFFHLEIPGETMVALRWDVKQFDPRGSPIARLLFLELKKYGLVTYSAWAENPVLTHTP